MLNSSGFIMVDGKNEPRRIRELIVGGLPLEPFVFPTNATGALKELWRAEIGSN